MQQYAEILGIELLYLPSYSPNLNLIERLWKYVKKECLYSKYYDTFDKFKTAIELCIYSANNDLNEKNKLKSLMTWKFQSFEKVNILNV